MTDAERQTIYATVPWRDRRWPEHAAAGPLPAATLLDAGGVVASMVGWSENPRRIITMPDGGVFEEGLGDDGGCYLRGA